MHEKQIKFLHTVSVCVKKWTGRSFTTRALQLRSCCFTPLSNRTVLLCVFRIRHIHKCGLWTNFVLPQQTLASFQILHLENSQHRQILRACMKISAEIEMNQRVPPSDPSPEFICCAKVLLTQWHFLKPMICYLCDWSESERGKIAGEKRRTHVKMTILQSVWGLSDLL